MQWWFRCFVARIRGTHADDGVTRLTPVRFRRRRPNSQVSYAAPRPELGEEILNDRRNWITSVSDDKNVLLCGRSRTYRLTRNHIRFVVFGTRYLTCKRFSEIFMERQRDCIHHGPGSRNAAIDFTQNIFFCLNVKQFGFIHNGGVFDRPLYTRRKFMSAPSGPTTVNAHGYYSEKVHRLFRLKRDTIESAREHGRKLWSFLLRIRVRSHCRFAK